MSIGSRAHLQEDAIAEVQIETGTHREEGKRADTHEKRFTNTKSRQTCGQTCGLAGKQMDKWTSGRRLA